MMPNFSYVRAESVAEAVTHLGAQDTRLHAGGTDLLGCLRDGVFSAGKIVSISGIEELTGIRRTADGLGIGALTTITEAATDRAVLELFPGLAEAAASVASPQLRNQGTMGGNICQKPRCWYYRGDFHCLRKGGDLCYAVKGENHFHCIFGGSGCFIVHPSDIAPALLALEARVSISGPKGKKAVPVREFFVPPGVDPTRETVLEQGEIVTGLLIPLPARGLKSSYRKVRARRSWDFAVAGVALALRMNDDKVQDARVVLSGAAPVPWRALGAEEALTGQRLDAATASRAAEAALHGARPLNHNRYKVPLFKGLLEESILALA